MRFITPAMLLVALTSVSLASACKKDEKKDSKSGDPATSAGSASGSSEDARRRPSLPAPRRLRGSGSPEAEAEAGGEEALPSDMDRRAERGERMTGMRERFDADGDGQLNDQERTAMRKERVATRMKALDTDGDGKISKQEAETSRRMFHDFPRVDANGDSFLSLEELEAARSRGGRNRRDHREPGDPPGDAPID